QTFHADFKERIHAFVMGHFFPSYTFDLDRTLYIMTSGRFEPHNKGFDLCLETMARLNLELKAARSDLTIVFFIVTSRPTRSIHPLVLEKRGVLNELRTVTNRITEQVGDRLFRTAASGAPPRLDDLVDEYWMLRFRRTQAAFKANALPPIITHILEDDANDPVLAHLRKLGLFNRQDDPVKVIYHPEFIGPANPLWGIEYDQFVRGCHLGLFPSAYEPWGYTPLECMALGTPSISSDLAGFGRYVREQHPELESKGVAVLERRGKSFHDAAAELTRRLLAFTKLTRRHRVEMRNEVERRSWDFDWTRLGTAYHQSHELALERSV
ncbi:MAG: glycosyltransferase, partial [Polyangiales bacterium]